MRFPDKIVLEHGGAFGDFLLAWPIFLSLARHFADQPLYHAVSSAHARWLAPLAAPCPPELRRALDARFASDRWPPALEHVLVVRPGLAVRPALPDNPGFWFLRGMEQGRTLSPTALYREALDERGIPFATDFADVFRGYFGRHAPTGNTALLFVGAGHRDKAWPLKDFEYLAGMLRDHGISPVFVCGPVERERGIVPVGSGILAPRNLRELSAALCAARFVVGPDCGPLHLAGLHGVPGVALFGPTAPAQWGPLGLTVVTAGLACSPCAAMTAGEFAPSCPRPLPCLARITTQAVWAALEGQGLL